MTDSIHSPLVEMGLENMGDRPLHRQTQNEREGVGRGESTLEMMSSTNGPHHVIKINLWRERSPQAATLK
jgi:hypothetical protein